MSPISFYNTDSIDVSHSHQWPIQYHQGEDTWSDDRDGTGTVEEFSFDHHCHGCGYVLRPHTAQRLCTMLVRQRSVSRWSLCLVPPPPWTPGDFHVLRRGGHLEALPAERKGVWNRGHQWGPGACTWTLHPIRVEVSVSVATPGPSSVTSAHETSTVGSPDMLRNGRTILRKQ